MTTSNSPPLGRTDPRWTLLYDARCGFCRATLALILRADRRRALRPVALGTPRADEMLHDLTPAQRAGSWHLVAADGQRWSAGAAAAPLLCLLPGGAAPAALLAAAPQTTERAYRWLADHRSTLGRLIPEAARRRAAAEIARRS